MSELKMCGSSLEEIKLEIDIIILDIESLGDNEMNEAVRYLGNSLEELKNDNNFENLNNDENQLSSVHVSLNSQNNFENKRIKLESSDHEGETNIESYVDEGMGHSEEDLGDYTDVLGRDTGKVQEPIRENINEQEYEQNQGETILTDVVQSASVSFLMDDTSEYHDDEMENYGIIKEEKANTEGSSPLEPFYNLESGSELVVKKENEYTAPPSLYNGKIPTCTECGSSFPSLGTLDAHIRNAHKKPNAVVSVRGLKTGEYESTHLISDSNGMFQCLYCEHKSFKKYDLSLHMNKHTGKYRCDTCDVNLTRQATLDRHNKSAEHLKKLNRNFASPRQMEQLAANFPPFHQFPQTNLIIPSPGDHHKLEQGDVVDQLFSENVNVDGQNFSMEFLLGSSPRKSEDTLMNSPVEPQPVTVSQNALNEYMNKQILNKNSERTNGFINPNKENFKCVLCANTFSRGDNLRRHMITHSGKHECPSCNQGFTERKRLENHMKDKENCKKLLMKRGQTFPPRQMPYEHFSQKPYSDFPHGLQMTNKESSDFGSFLNPSLKQKLVSNPDISIQVKNENMQS